MSNIWRSIALVVAVMFGLTSGGLASAPVALAAPVHVDASIVAPANIGVPVPALSYRPGARWGQIDILMDGYETAKVAKSFWGGSVVCWPAAVAGFAGGIAGSTAAFGACISIATVCAAKAYLSKPRKRAAMTLTVWGSGWCWKY